MSRIRITSERLEPLKPWVGLLGLCWVASACSSSSNDMAGTTQTGYTVVASDGTPPSAVAGDALALRVVRKMSDGTTAPLSPAAQVTWSGPAVVTALPAGSKSETTVLPVAAATPTAMWLVNPEHFSSEDLLGVLWVLDAGTSAQPVIAVTAMVSESDGGAASATASIVVAPTPAGDAASGQSLYASNCAVCHGTIGQGDAQFPGLNSSAGNVAADPSWSAASMAISARSDTDNLGISLDPAMPRWLLKTGADGKFLSTKAYADIYAWLKTQM